MPSYDDAVARTRLELDKHDARAAFAMLRPVLEYPGQIQDPGRWSEALDLFARVAAAAGKEELGRLARAAATAPAEPRVLIDFGSALSEVHLDGVAATMLARADGLQPGDEEIVGELATALAGCRRHADAYALLRKNRPLAERDFLLCYLLAFNAVMAADLDEARGQAPRLRGLAAPDEQWGPERIEGFLARADLMRGVTPLDGTDLRGWHFVLTGSLLLHLSPHGLDAGMNGRHGFLQDSEQLCLEGIKRLEAVLGALELRPPRIFALADRASAILGHAVGAVLRLPIAPWPSPDPGLIVAYDLASLTTGPEGEALREHRPGQHLFAHASCWTERQPVAADMVTLLYQHNRPPWELRTDPGNRRSSPSELAGTPGELGQRLASLALDEGALGDLTALTRLASAARPLAAALRGEGTRERQFAGSPVPSSRFS